MRQKLKKTCPMKEDYFIRLFTIKSFVGARSGSLVPRLLILFVLPALAIMPLPVSAAVKAVPILNLDLASVNASITGTMVEVKATIKSITPPSEGSGAPFKLKLSDDKASITLIIWRDLWELLNKQYNPVVGDVIALRAVVIEYGGQIQLTLKGVADFEMLAKMPIAGSNPEAPAAENSGGPPIAPAPTPPSGVSETTNPPSAVAIPAPQPTPVNKNTTAFPSPPMPLSKVSLSIKGQEIVVQAAVTSVRDPSSESAPYIVTLSDGSANVKLVYWKNFQAEVGLKLRTGNTVRAKVTVGEYRGALELRLADAKSVEVIGPPLTK
jgi:OB-fold nucleic acid binding domain